MSDFRRMIVILIAEYWRLVVDDLFILTLQAEYNEMAEELDAREGHGRMRPPGPYSLWMYLKTMLRHTMWGDTNIIAAVSRLFALCISVINANDGDCSVTLIRHSHPLLKMDIVLIFNGGSHYSACRKYFV